MRIASGGAFASRSKQSRSARAFGRSAIPGTRALAQLLPDEGIDVEGLARTAAEVFVDGPSKGRELGLTLLEEPKTGMDHFAGIAGTSGGDLGFDERLRRKQVSRQGRPLRPRV